MTGGVPGMLEAGRRPMRQGARALVASALAVVLALESVPVAYAQEYPPTPPGEPAPLPAEPLPVPARVYDLKRAIEVAVQNHPAVAVSGMRSQAAKTGIAAEGAKYRPFIQGNAAAERVLAGDQSRVIGDTSVTNTVPAEQIYSGSLNLVVPLVREGKLVFVTLPSEEAAKARYEATRNRTVLTQSDVVGNVTVTFYTALSAQADLKVSEQFVELNRVLLQASRLRFQQQLVPETEVKAAEAALAASEADLAVARINVSRTLSDFATAVGVDPSPDGVEGIELLEQSELPSPPDPLESMIKRVVVNHPSVLAQEATVRESEAILKVLVSQRYPNLDFSTRLGGADTSGSTTNQSGTTQDTERRFWSLRALLTLNWRIWDFGALSLRLKEQSETIQAEKLALAEVRSTVSKGVITAYRNVTGSRARLTSAEKAVDLAEQLARSARERYQQNLIPRSELLRAEANLAAARKALIQTEYSVRVDQAMLRIAMGTEGP